MSFKTDFDYRTDGDGVSAQFGIKVDEHQWQQLDSYIGLLSKWNRVHNLTAIRDVGEMWVKHVLDSCSLIPYLSINHPLLDIGSGAGLPGMVVSVLLPDLPVVLLDSNIKKVTFLRQVKSELALQNISVIHSRVETYVPDAPFEQVVARSVSSLANLANWTRGLIMDSGKFLAMKIDVSDDEFEALPDDFCIADVHKVRVPFLEKQNRFIYEMRPIRPT